MKLSVFIGFVVWFLILTGMFFVLMGLLAPSAYLVSPLFAGLIVYGYVARELKL